MVDNSPVSGKIPGGHEASLLNSKKKVEEEVLEPAFKFNICSSWRIIAWWLPQ